MTKQEIFTKVKDHLLKQNSRAVGEFGDCMYLAEDGKRCAIGCLLSKAHAKRLYGNISMLLKRKVKEVEVLLPTDLTDKEEGRQFLQQLQGIHDCFNVIPWSQQLKDFANKHNLEY